MKTCAITGHRATRFKFKYNENYAGCKRLKKRLHDQFILLYEQGVRRFLVGGGLGVDMWSGEILLRLKELPEYSDIELVIVLPHPGHDDRWDERSKKRMAFLLKHCTEHLTIGTDASPESFYKRNRYLVDHADYLVAVYDNDRTVRSGTGMTVRYAEQQEKIVILIHPDTGCVLCPLIFNESIAPDKILRKKSVAFMLTSKKLQYNSDMFHKWLNSSSYVANCRLHLHRLD